MSLVVKWVRATRHTSLTLIEAGSRGCRVRRGQSFRGHHLQISTACLWAKYRNRHRSVAAADEDGVQYHQAEERPPPPVHLVGYREHRSHGHHYPKAFLGVW